MRKKPTPEQAAAAIIATSERLTNLNTVFNQFQASSEALRPHWGNDTEMAFRRFMRLWADDLARLTMARAEQIKQQTFN